MKLLKKKLSDRLIACSLPGIISVAGVATFCICAVRRKKWSRPPKQLKDRKRRQPGRKKNVISIENKNSAPLHELVDVSDMARI